MAYVNHRLRRKNGNSWDTYHLETNSSAVLRFKTEGNNTTANGTVESALTSLESAVADLTGTTGVSTKADKVTSATTGNFAGLNADGNLTDSGKKASDFANATHTHNASDINALTKNRALTTDSNGKLKVSTTTDTELGYVHGVTSAIQTQIDNIKTTADGAIPSSEKGAANGVATLGADSKIPAAQLPSYVDDVLEYTSKDNFPRANGTVAPEKGKIYVDTTTNLTYRWSGSSYVEISQSLALGETSSTAYAGDKGKTAYEHSQATHARVDATKTEASTVNGKIKIDGTDVTVYTHPEAAGTKTDAASSAVAFAGTINAVSSLTLENGHVTGYTVTPYTIPAKPTTITGNAGTATKLATGRNLKVKLDSTNSQSFDGSANATNIGVDGTLPVDNGGTGATTVVGARQALEASKLEVNATAPSSPGTYDFWLEPTGQSFTVNA